MHWSRISLLFFVTLLAAALAGHAQQESVHLPRGGGIEYARDDLGNRIPDFSHCGYAGGNHDIPAIAAKVVVTPIEGDDGARIQAAIDYVAELALDEQGFRGAVLLAPGVFQVEGQIRITASGVVLRGSGAAEGGTTIFATGPDRRQLIRVEGEGERHFLSDEAVHISDDYVPVGATEITAAVAGEFHTGDRVLLTRPSTEEWVKAIGADTFGLGWRAGTRDIRWDRVITAVDGNKLSLDAPITTALDKKFGGGTVQKVEWPGRIENVGIEDLQLKSAYADGNPHDEEHAWFGVTMQNVENAWVRRVEFRHFAGGAVLLRENTKNITVEDCVSLDPISELGGYRRHTFFTQGQQTLFLRCWSEHGRHDYAVGHCAPGPNAFVSCYAENALDDSGPLESWASGVLFDNVRIDGAGLKLVNRWISPPAAGWAAANCVLWQCRSGTMHCFRPPTANNWSIGCWSQFYGDGTFEGQTDFVEPLSLYQGQLRERLGAGAAKRVDPVLLKVRGATNPTYEEAAEFVARSDKPGPRMIDLIRERFHQAIGNSKGEPEAIDAILLRAKPSEKIAAEPKPLRVENGWLVADGKLVTGSRIHPMWWRGNIRPDDVAQFGPGVARFAPGRDGVGMTDDLEEVAKLMRDRHVAALEHHYGLWYDRRRDTHLMERAEDGDVAPPFYEQPFARTGAGRANDGLSLYDLTKYNSWYWNRLATFADLCDRDGLMLLHQNYFQHNILEAGAHWVDSPWRSANNVNDTGFPEPPPFVGDKRIFQAHLFYDVSNEHRRELHRRYIRQCLDNFAANSNVVQMTSGEYTGPLEFMQFWLDTIADWQRGHHRDVLVALSATKDVQDAILADPVRSKIVDVIDIRYWWYEADGELYAPEGGKNLAPRQHMRQLQPGRSSFASVLQAVREYRLRFPEKAVIYSANGEGNGNVSGWAVLIGGGSLPEVDLPPELAQAIPAMAPVDDKFASTGPWCLAAADGAMLVYPASRAETELPHLKGSRKYEARWVNLRTLEVISRKTTGNHLADESGLWLVPRE